MAARLKETPSAASSEQSTVEAATNTTMPVDLVPHQEAFELAGFSFGDIVGSEYSDVQIPDGWRHVSVGEYKVDLFDERNRLRAEVRRKTATLLPRYRVTEAADQPGFVTWQVVDSDTVLFRATSSADDYAGQDQHFEDALKWLRVRYDRAENPLAYW